MRELDPNSKSGFIRQNLDLPTGDIIAKAKEEGLKISSGLIGMVRSKSKGQKPKKMKRMKASALRKNSAAKPKRKYTRRAKASNGKTPVSVSALVEKFVADLKAVNSQLLRDSLEGVL